MFLIKKKKYYKNKSEVIKEIRNIKNIETLKEYVDKIDEFISSENLLDILDY